MKNGKSNKKIMGIAAGLLVAGIAAACMFYINDYYHSEEAVDAYLNGTEQVKVLELKNGLLLDSEGDEKALIFYPGAKVEYTAYVPLFMELAEQGLDCFMVKMPCNLAILGMNEAEKIMEEYEGEYEEWYLAGHSLGGAMAASFAAEHQETLDGLILLAAYSTKSFESEEFRVLSIYGSEDTVLNREKLEEGRALMPEDYKEFVIEGGNHAQFGYYGIQEGDGEAVISREEQIRQTVEVMVDFVG